MVEKDFMQIKEQFSKADTDEKIKIYTETQDLSKEQYLELLRMFPVNEIGRLEMALK